MPRLPSPWPSQHSCTTPIGNPRPSFCLILHHTDGEREFAYVARSKSSGTLIEGLRQAPQRGWTVVDMRRDWKTVYSPK
jgi:hypothetical protein